jgi:aminoglycoside/choline kinase family phosphotransferase
MSVKKSNAQRQREHRAKLIRRGLVRRQVWVHEQNMPEFAQLEKLLMSEQFNVSGVVFQDRKTGRLQTVRLYDTALSGNADFLFAYSRNPC